MQREFTPNAFPDLLLTPLAICRGKSPPQKAKAGKAVKKAAHEGADAVRKTAQKAVDAVKDEFDDGAEEAKKDG